MAGGSEWGVGAARQPAHAASWRVPEPRAPSLGDGDQAGCGAPKAHSFPLLPDYGETWEQRLQLGVGISCVIVLAVCVSCYISIIK